MRHDPGPQAHHSELRKHRRFDLQFPVFLRFSAGEVAHQYEGMSENVSVGGLLIKTVHELPLRAKVKLTMELAGLKSLRAIRLSADGEVVRVEPSKFDGVYAIAIKCHGSIAAMRKHLQTSTVAKWLAKSAET
jgi:PilZ domain